MKATEKELKLISRFQFQPSRGSSFSVEFSLRLSSSFSTDSAPLRFFHSGGRLPLKSVVLT